MTVTDQSRLADRRAAGPGSTFAKRGRGSSRRINDFFILGLPEVELFVPYDKQGVIGDIRRNVHVIREDCQKDGLHLKVKADPKMVTALKKRIAA
jgi:hypothetical protein